MASDRATDPNSARCARIELITGGLPPDEEMAVAMEHQAALLLGRLGLHEAHVCPGDRFADGLSVSGIVLLRLT